MSLSGQEAGEKGNSTEITDTLEGHSSKGPRIPYNIPQDPPPKDSQSL